MDKDIDKPANKVKCVKGKSHLFSDKNAVSRCVNCGKLFLWVDKKGYALWGLPVSLTGGKK